MDPIKSGAIFKLKSPSTTPTHPPPHPSPVNGISRSSAWTQWSPQPVASPHIQRFCYSHAMASIQTPPQSSPQKFDFNGAPQSAPSSGASSIKNSMLKHSFDRIYRATPLPPNIDRELFRLPVQPQSSSAAISAPTSQGMTAEYSPPRFYSSAQHSANEREHTNNKLDTVQHHEQHHTLPTATTFPNSSVHPSDPSIKSAYPPVIPLPAHVQRSQTHGNLSKSGQFGHSIPFGSPSHSSHITRILPGSSHVIVESSINHQASLPERSTAKNHLPLWNTEASSDPPIKSTNLEKEPSQSFQPQPIAPIVTVRYGGMNLSSDVHDLYEIDDTCKRTSTFDDVSDTKNRETDVPTVKKSPLHNQIDDIKPLFDSEDGDNMAGVDGSGYDDYQQHIMDDIDDQRIDSEWEVVEDKAMISNSVNSENKERQSTEKVEKSERNPIISNNYGDEPEETVVKSPAYSVQNNDQNISASKDSSKDVLRSFFVDVDEETVPSSSVIPRKQHIISPREDSKCEAVVIGIVAEPPPDNSIVSVTVNSTTTTRSTAPSAGSRGRGMGRGMATDSLLAFIHQPIVGSLPSTSNTASGAGRGFSATKRPNLVNQSEMHSRDTSSSLLSNQRQESIAHSSVQDSFISSSTGRSLKSPLMSVERSIPANDMPAMNKSALTVSKINATKVNDKHNEIIDKPTNIPGNLKQAPSQTRVNKPVDTETGLFRLNDNATVKAKNKTKPPKIKRALDSQSDDNSAIDDSDYNSEEKLSPVAQKRGRGRPKKIRLDTTDASFNASVAYKHTKTGRWTKPISKLLDEVQGVDGSSTNAVSVIKTSIANVKPNQNETVVASSSSSATSLPITSSSSITMISRKLLEQLNGEDDNSTKRKGSQAKSGTVREWQAQESVALYSVHAKTDATNPNFWGLISEQLKQRGFHRSPEECEQRWYAALYDTQKRREKVQQRQKASKVTLALEKIQEISEQKHGAGSSSLGKSANLKKVNDDFVNHDDDHYKSIADVEEFDESYKHGANNIDKIQPTKKRRLGKNDMKILAEQSAKAAKNDDIFDAIANRGQSLSFKRNNESSLGKPISTILDDSLILDISSPITTKSSLPVQKTISSDDGLQMFHSNHVHKIHTNRIRPQLIAPLGTKPSISPSGVLPGSKPASIASLQRKIGKAVDTVNREYKRRRGIDSDGESLGDEDTEGDEENEEDY